MLDPGWAQQLATAIMESQEMLLLWLLLARTIPIILLTPYLGGKVIPNEVKIGLGGGLAILAYPFAVQGITTLLPSDPISYMFLLSKEVLIGFIIGFINAHIFMAMDMAGRMIDTARGTSMSEVQDPLSKQRVTPTGNLYIQLFIILFISLGGHRIFFESYFDSFVNIPVDKGISFASIGAVGLGEVIYRLTGDLWSIALMLSAPIMAATFLSDLVFGVLNRIAPQLNAYFMSMPVKAYGGLAMLFISMNAIVMRFEGFAEESLTWLLKVMRLLEMAV